MAGTYFWDEMKVLKLHGPLIRTQLLIHVEGDICVKYPNNPLITDKQFSVRMDRLDFNSTAENPDYAMLETSCLPPLQEPEWNQKNCVAQWRDWRYLTALHSYVERPIPTNAITLDCLERK